MRVLVSTVGLHKHADAHPTPGDHAGNLEGPAALGAHQAVPRPQAALGTAAPRLVAVRVLVPPWLSLPRVWVLLVPLLTLASSHDARLLMVIFDGSDPFAFSVASLSVQIFFSA